MKYCVIVDAYSTGNQLAKYFRDNGYTLIHVQSSKTIPKILKKSFKSMDFVSNFIFEEDIDNLVNQLEPYSPSIIITGSETGVVLADSLSHHFEVAGNNVLLSTARRNKFDMIKTISNYGLQTAQQIQSSDLNEILKWSKKIDSWPIVIKPLNSAASDDVRFCKTSEDIKDAYYNIMNKINSLGYLNTEVLAQEYIAGKQYMVNAVTINGEHYITDIWYEGLVEIEDSSIIYDYWDLLPMDDEKYKELISYTKSVLTSLGIEYGASHTEIRLTDKGPVIIESGARTMGLSIDEQILKEALGYTQAELTAYSFIDNEIFYRKYFAIKKQRKKLRITFLISNINGSLKPGIFNINDLSTVEKINLTAENNLINITNEPMNHPGWVYQLSDSFEDIENEYNEIRHNEMNGEYYKEVVPYF
ncbi:ATP-grasp domain-containing protein [Lysinibacillus sphaericus]|uniref:ATP-grasp domain-containing protein n=1 Tax=Lysinibacillus sphaericus TaxID=1421 RepID=UPI0018CD799F|nr:ATP-grasp domain-containing protein [Lysinibacillus sphaericus]